MLPLPWFSDLCDGTCQCRIERNSEDTETIYVHSSGGIDVQRTILDRDRGNVDYFDLMNSLKDQVRVVHKEVANGS